MILSFNQHVDSWISKYEKQPSKPSSYCSWRLIWGGDITEYNIGRANCLFFGIDWIELCGVHFLNAQQLPVLIEKPQKNINTRGSHQRQHNFLYHVKEYGVYSEHAQLPLVCTAHLLKSSQLAIPLRICGDMKEQESTTCYTFTPLMGSFTCLSIEQWIQGTLWLYVTCDWLSGRSEIQMNMLSTEFKCRMPNVDAECWI